MPSYIYQIVIHLLSEKRNYHVKKLVYIISKSYDGGWGDSSVGKVLALQVQGPGFNPQQRKKKKNSYDDQVFTNRGLQDYSIA